MHAQMGTNRQIDRFVGDKHLAVEMGVDRRHDSSIPQDEEKSHLAAKS
jgi:hypothetical protein